MGVDARAAILDLLSQRDPGVTICPSEAARALAEDWRPLMPVVREAAAGLVIEGEVEVLQGGRVVDLASARGPVRIRRVQNRQAGAPPTQ